MDCKYFQLRILPRSEWFWEWGFTIPTFKNHSRFIFDFPIGYFTIHGWLFWGKKQNA